MTAGAGETMRAFLALAIGLLLGSVLPADLLARARGIEIRDTGDGNPGTINAIRALGWASGLLTAAYDASIGVVAIWLAGRLGLPEGTAYLAGVMTIVGHRFPVFLGFRRGGQGMAASAGMIVYGVAVAVSRGWLSTVDVAALVAIAVVAFVWTRSDIVVAVVLMPALVLGLLFAGAGWPYLAFMATVAANIWVVQVLALRRLPSRESRPARRPSR